MQKSGYRELFYLVKINNDDEIQNSILTVVCVCYQPKNNNKNLIRNSQKKKKKPEILQ